MHKLLLYRDRCTYTRLKRVPQPVSGLSTVTALETETYADADADGDGDASSESSSTGTQAAEMCAYAYSRLNTNWSADARDCPARGTSLTCCRKRESETSSARLCVEVSKRMFCLTSVPTRERNAYAISVGCVCDYCESEIVRIVLTARSGAVVVKYAHLRDWKSNCCCCCGCRVVSSSCRFPFRTALEIFLWRLALLLACLRSKGIAHF